jgi:hypothetical protein
MQCFGGPGNGRMRQGMCERAPGLCEREPRLSRSSHGYLRGTTCWLDPSMIKNGDVWDCSRDANEGVMSQKVESTSRSNIECLNGRKTMTRPHRSMRLDSHLSDSGRLGAHIDRLIADLHRQDDDLSCPSTPSLPTVRTRQRSETLHDAHGMI